MTGTTAFEGSLSPGLLDWYAREKKSLPWRDDPRVYWVWIGEIMSQQTTLKVVIPRFKAFVHRFPDLSHLANCSESDLREMWSGLGYYARARNIRKGARYILDEYAGRFPDTYQKWLDVPGCGPYTAAVIASVCFGEGVVAVDGNGTRVGSRLLDMRENVWSTPGRRRLGMFLQSQIRGDFHPGDFNQAVMELGQEICRKSEPLCKQCPLLGNCLAYQRDSVALCPPAKPRPTPVKICLDVVAAVRKDGELVGLGTRTSGFLAETIGFPLEIRGRDQAGSLEDFLQGMGLQFERKTKSFKHTITKHKLECRVLRVRVDEAQWDRTLENKLIAHLSVDALAWIGSHRVESQLSSSLDQKAWKVITT